MTEAARRIEAEADLEHDEKAGAEGRRRARARGARRGDVAADGTRAVAVFACQPEDLFEVVALRHPLDSRVVLDRTPPTSSRSSYAGAAERWCVLLANRRVARLFIGDGDELEETDRIEDDVHRQHDQGGWSQANYQRSVDKEKDDHLQRTADAAFALYKRRGFDRLLVGAPEELVGELEAQAALLPARPPGRPRHLRRRALDARRGALVRRRADRRARPHDASARRSTAWPRASAAATAASAGCRACSTRSTRRAWRRCWSSAASPSPRLHRRGRAALRRRTCPAATPLRRHRREGDREGDRAVGRR